MSTSTLVPTTRSYSALRYSLTGAAIGLVWGAVMRVWMRYISSSPEFSWSGTLFILGASFIVGAVLGLARQRRLAGGAGYWRLSLASLLLLGAGGAVMWPSVVLGAIAFARSRPNYLRGLLVAGAVAAQIPVVLDIADNWRFDTVDVALATVWYAPMLAFEAWAFSVVFAPQLGDRVPTRVRAVLIPAAVAGIALILVVAVGISAGM
jgi:hypothetical protein